MEQPLMLAIDLGAESGRAITGYLSKNKLITEEIHRFPNKVIYKDRHLYWNIDSLFKHINGSIKKVFVSHNSPPISIGIDSWGVDYGLIDKSGKLLELPYCYRDPRTNDIMNEFFAIFPKEKIYEHTGIQFLQFNTLYQLYAAKKYASKTINQAQKLLLIPDIFNYLLSGQMASEFTMATTTQLYNPLTGLWDDELLNTLGIPKKLFSNIKMPGTILSVINKVKGLNTPVNINLINVASHDTASAVTAIPAKGDNWAYISSGTWSLVGIETSKPLISPDSLRHNFTNEGGFDNKFRFLKNVMGLWLLQQCTKIWAINPGSLGLLLKKAQEQKAFKHFVDPDWEGFFNPVNMIESIEVYCKMTGQKAPASRAQYTRTILESLAFKYRYIIEEIESVTFQHINKIHIIGGGVKNEVLCQFTANATGREVIAGPVEATAIGNIMVQAYALGLVKDHQEIRNIVAHSVETKKYSPRDRGEWDNAYFRFLNLINKSR